MEKLEYWNKLVLEHAHLIKEEIQNQQTVLAKQYHRLIDELVVCVIENKPLDDQLIQELSLVSSFHFSRFLMFAVFPHFHDIEEVSFEIKEWSFSDPFIDSFIRNDITITSHQILAHIANKFIATALLSSDESNFQKKLTYLHEKGFSDKQITLNVIESSSGYGLFFDKEFGVNNDFPSFFLNSRSGAVDIDISTLSRTLSPFGAYVLSSLKSSNFGSMLQELIQVFQSDWLNDLPKFSWFRFHFFCHPESIIYEDYLIIEDYRKYVNLLNVKFLLYESYEEYIDLVLEVVTRAGIPMQDLIAFYYTLNDVKKGAFDAQIVALNEDCLAFYKEYSESLEVFNSHGVIKYFDFLASESHAKAKERIVRFVEESAVIPYRLVTYIHKNYKELTKELFLVMLKKDFSIQYRFVSQRFYDNIFLFLKEYDLSDVLLEILHFLNESANRKTREIACECLIPYLSNIREQAITLIKAKTVNSRVLGAILLSKYDDQQIKDILSDTINTERNDDTRDIMLESLQSSRFEKPYTMGQLREMVSFASQRKKLNKWSEKFLNEEGLSKLYFTNGELLTNEEVRFLFYRMKRAKGINSDIEAKQLILHIDKEKTTPFVKDLLKAFAESKSNPKLKYYLTIVGLVGNDEVSHQLMTLFSKNMADKRMKMAEYVLGSIAMLGTDAALRDLDGIYRKFENKKPAISIAAEQALRAAAKEQNISMDQLADRIIPDFGFEELSKHIVTDDGKEYRAFINAQFKLSFLDENHKLRKTIPKGISNDLKKDLKMIEKEIKQVIKTQSLRLEKYMIQGRQWSVEEWDTFFFHNPIMFVYASQLLWGLFDSNGVLQSSFYCSEEDVAYYDIEDEEIDLTEFENSHIRIIHPFYLDDESLEKWKAKFYDLGLKTVFPIFEREVFYALQEEKKTSSSKRFLGQSVPRGADFVNTFLVKRNWMKTVGDGGRSEFTKSYGEGDIYAYANIEGPAAYYQGGEVSATVHEINFYTRNRGKILTIGELDPLFYSEIIYDITLLLAQ